MVAKMKVLLVGGLALAFVVAGAGFLFAQKISRPQIPVKAAPAQEVKKAEPQKFVWGMERLEEAENAKDISQEDVKIIKELIEKGGLFFNANDMRNIVGAGAGSVAACGSDCDWCCCDSRGNNCYCCSGLPSPDQNPAGNVTNPAGR